MAGTLARTRPRRRVRRPAKARRRGIRPGPAGLAKFTHMTVLICTIVLVCTFWAVAVACLLLTLALGRAGGQDGQDEQAQP
jgi:hypothetical protein